MDRYTRFGEEERRQLEVRRRQFYQENSLHSFERRVLRKRQRTEASVPEAEEPQKSELGEATSNQQ